MPIWFLYSSDIYGGYAVPIWFLYSSILIGIFCTSLTFQDRTPSPLPSPACFFLSAGSVSAEEGEAPVPSKYNTARHQSKKNKCSSGYSQSTSLLAHNRITAPQLIAFRSPAKDLIDPVKPQSLPIHCIRLTSRNISFIIQRTIITSQMPLHNIRIPHN